MSPGVNFDLVKLVLSLSHKKKKKNPSKVKQRWSKFLWYVSNFSTAKLNWSNFYALTEISQTWHILKEHLSSKASFHVSTTDYCTLSSPRRFRGKTGKIRDSSVVSEPPIQLAQGLSCQCMSSSLRNDALRPCGEVHPLRLQYIITGSFVPDWPAPLFTVHLTCVASFSLCSSSSSAPTREGTTAWRLDGGQLHVFSYLCNINHELQMSPRRPNNIHRCLTVGGN